MNRFLGSVLVAGIGVAAHAGCSSDKAVSQTVGGAGGSATSSGASVSSGGSTTAGSTCLPSCPETFLESKQDKCCPGEECSYGLDPRPTCRDTAYCRQSGHGVEWVKASSPCAANLPGQCSSVPGPNSACSVPFSSCNYTGGVECYCVPHASGPIWSCGDAPSESCPKLSPNIGASCVMAASSCVYGTCDAGNKIEFQCIDGAWGAMPSSACAKKCPDIEPKDDLAFPCTTAVAECSYGDDVRPKCRRRYSCSLAVFAFWTVNPLTCPALPTGSCPASPSASGPCGPSGLICVYKDGAQCSCVDAKDRAAWQCASAPSNGCPAIAPNLFQPCASILTGVTCTYGSCDAGTFASLLCSEAGVWALSGLSCK